VVSRETASLEGAATLDGTLRCTTSSGCAALAGHFGGLTLTDPSSFVLSQGE
jgi:hypothetical protein